MDISKTQSKPNHLMQTAPYHQFHYRNPGHSVSEPEPGRWPLQIVDDNAETARQLAAYQARQKTSKQPAGSNQNDGRHRTLAATYHPSPQRRRGLDESACQADSSAPMYHDEQLTYERRTKSYRDTTSEIISLYASRNALAHGATAAPSDDDGSSCTSLQRYPASQRQVHSSNNHLQNTNWAKSRTPAPYPTRLRRPGAGVISPKLMDARTHDYGSISQYERAPQKSAPNLYKASLAKNQRRAPPLSLRPEMNKSSCSLPSRYSPGPNHYRTASGRARTPSSTVSWVSRPSDRYLGSTDQSTRSASLTSIVEMYQRPLTASSTCPAIRPGRTLFYDYSEEFNTAGCDNASETAMPLSPIPHRAGGVGQPVILRQDSDIKMQSALDNEIIPEPTNFTYKGGYNRNRYASSIDESFDSYLQGSHDDSIEEIERVIANAISTAAADKLMAATERLKAYPENFHYRKESHSSESKNAGNDGRLPSATERQYGIKPTGNFGISTAIRRASQASINRNAMALDPAFADFTSLLSSFERLAKSPFSRLSDEDDTDERASKRSSGISQMEILDEIERVQRPYQKRHRRNVATAQVNNSALSIGESVAEQPPSSDEDTMTLKPQPLSPNRQKKIQLDLRQKCMKALPPLPAKKGPEGHYGAALGPASEGSKNDSGISEVRSATPRNQISRSNSPAKLRLRVRTPSLHGDTDAAASPYGARATRQSADEYAANPSSKAPPKLRLKISRNQLGHGRSTQTGSVIRNNRLKQCNALADVAQPPRLDIAHRPDGIDRMTANREYTGSKRVTTAPSEEKGSLDESCRPSDQFNLSYPPTPVEASGGSLPRPESPRESVDELQTVQSEAGDLVPRRLKPKFSFLRLRSATSAAPATLVKPTPPAMRQGAGLNGKLTNGNVDSVALSNLEAARDNNPPPSLSVKSERVGNRMKRWATDAKRAVRSYVRRTLVRSPKSTHL